MLPGVRDLRERLDAAVKTSAWSAVAGAAALTMLGFLCAALFLYLQNWRGPIVACLILAGAFLVSAGQGFSPPSFIYQGF